MRSSRTLVILGLITLAVVLAAIFGRQESTAIPRQGERVFPQLMANINDVTEVVGQSSTDTFTLNHRDDRWVVKERAGYPADVDKVHQLLVGTAQLQRVEPKTRNPELYKKIGVEDVNKAGAKSVQISVKNANGSTLAEFILGERRWGAGDPNVSQYYVRLADDPQAWLVEGNFPQEKSATSWLDDEILAIDSARVREVRVTHPKRHKVTVRRRDPNANDYQLVGLPKGAELESQWTVNGIANTLTNLTLDDVRPASDIKFKKRPDLSVELDTFDGLRVNMKTMKEGDKNLARISAKFDRALIREDAEAKSDPEQSETEDASNKSKLKDPEAVKKEAEKLTARWQDWVYVVPQYHIDSLAKKKADLIKPKNKQETR